MKPESEIDVIIPVYNGAKYIKDALFSVEQQTVSPVTIIVIDDGSTDDTFEIVLNYKKQSSMNIVIIQKQNGGPNSARNVGIKNSSSHFLAFLDADDVWEKNKLELQLNVFENSKIRDLGIVYGRYGIIDGQGKKTSQYFIYNPETCLRGYIFNELLAANKICGSGSAVLIKRECFNQVGYFDETLRAAEDWDMWLRLSEHFTFDYVDKIIVQIRRHEANGQNDQLMCFLNELTFYVKWSERLSERDTIGDERALFITNSLRKFYFRPVFLKAIFGLPKRVKKIFFWKTNGSIFLYVLLRIQRILYRKLAA